VWPGRVAGPGFARGNVPEHTSLRGNASACANRYVPGDPRLSRQDRTVTDCYRAGDAYLRRGQTWVAKRDADRALASVSIGRIRFPPPAMR